MSNEEKIVMIESILNIQNPNSAIETQIETYLNLAGKEILQWRFSGRDDVPEEIPDEYDVVQVFAVVAGYNQQGAEGQSMHSENNVYLTFSYADMVHYIRKNVIPYVKVIG